VPFISQPRLGYITVRTPCNSINSSKEDVNPLSSDKGQIAELRSLTQAETFLNVGKSWGVRKIENAHLEHH
jgi:hypothetical protein